MRISPSVERTGIQGSVTLLGLAAALESRFVASRKSPNKARFHGGLSQHDVQVSGC
jgi:hypothetical protein